jgi:hypothetical protein
MKSWGKPLKGFPLWFFYGCLFITVKITTERKRLQSPLGHISSKLHLSTFYLWARSIIFYYAFKPVRGSLCINQGVAVACCLFWIPGKDHKKDAPDNSVWQAVCTGRKKLFWRPLKMIHYYWSYSCCVLWLKSINHTLTSNCVWHIILGPERPTEVWDVIIILKESQI